MKQSCRSMFGQFLQNNVDCFSCVTKCGDMPQHTSHFKAIHYLKRYRPPPIWHSASSLSAVLELNYPVGSAAGPVFFLHQGNLHLMLHYRLHEGPECQKAYIHHSGARHSVGAPSVVKTAVV